MANAVILNEGAILLLNWELGRSDPNSSTQKIGLINAPITPVPGSVYSDFSIATGDGLDAQVIDPAEWQAPTIVSDRANSIYGAPTPFEWTYTGSSSPTIYGYLAWDVGGPTGLWAQMFDFPRVLNTSDTLSEQLTFTGGACT